MASDIEILIIFVKKLPDCGIINQQIKPSTSTMGKFAKRQLLRFEYWRRRAMALLRYMDGGVWDDTRDVWWVKVAKTINLSIKSFLNTNLQAQACAMTYRTILAIVPALALFLAIGRGFGLQKIIEGEVYKFFPSQGTVVDQSIGVVDSYLNNASEGLFVGIGIVFLLWTLISLLSSLENSFNIVWSIKQGRSIWRKITDYTAMLLILPVLMICSSGLTIMISSTLQTIFDWSFMTPVIELIMESGAWVLTWLFFTAAYLLVPNTKVRIENALLGGVVAGTGFKILQWLFVTGQLYVTRYNAVYGGFAFVPLLLLWVQLAWMTTLMGALLCYASQNINLFSFSNQIEDISLSYRQRVAVAVATVITRRFIEEKEAPTVQQISNRYLIPPKLVSQVVGDLAATGLISRVVVGDHGSEIGYQPGIDINLLTVEMVIDKLKMLGGRDFIPHFNRSFASVNKSLDELEARARQSTVPVYLKDLKVHAVLRSQISESDAPQEEKSTINK
jgi:membrane protein